MNKFCIGRCICWNTDQVTCEDAINEMFNNLVASKLPLDVIIDDYYVLYNENGEIIDEC